MLVADGRILVSLRKVIPLGLAVLLITAALLKALFDFDTAWDSLAYHLPFAALRVGIVDAAHFQITGMIKYYYDGFPVLGDYLKGWLWRAFDRPEAPNLVSTLSFICVVVYVWRSFRIPFAWVTLGLAAIPAVQTTFTRNQLDFPANAFMTIFVLSVCDGFAAPNQFGRSKLAVAVLSAAFAAHLKPQMVVQVGLVLGVVVATTIVLVHRRDALFVAALSRLRPGSMLLLGGVSLALIFSEALFHWYELGSPLYPLTLSIGGFRVFKGPIPPWGLWPEPTYSAHYPGPFRWLLSVMEYHAFDYRRIPYTLGNGDVPEGAMSMHVGGYMGLAVLFSVGMFLIATRARRDRSSRTFTLALILVTVFAAFVPGAHELRYAMYWMMFLVLGALILLADPAGRLARESRVYKMFLLSTLLYVVLITGGEHVVPRFRGVAYFEKMFRVEEKLEAAVGRESTICLDKFPQLAILYSPNFHPRLFAARPYAVRSEGWSISEKNYLSTGSAVCTWISP